jgi:hypothetical protein
VIRLPRIGSAFEALRAVMDVVEPRELARVSALRTQRALGSNDFGDEYQRARPYLVEMQYAN